MKLYMHPASTTSRPVMQFIADNKLPVESQVVDIFKGEHHGEAYARLNPNRLIPMLEDGDFRLTESAAILRYLADTSGGSAAAAYPKEPRRRAKVDEMLDWLNSNFYRDWGYGFVYPQVFPNLKRSDPVAQAATVAWGRDKSKTWLADPQRSLARTRPRLSLRQRGHHRRLFRVEPRHRGRARPLRHHAPSQHRALGGDDEEPAELRRCLSGVQRLLRLHQGPGVRGPLGAHA